MIKILTKIFDEDVSLDEAASFDLTKNDYELLFWKTLNDLANEIKDIDSTTLNQYIIDVNQTKDSNKAWKLLSWHGIFSPYTQGIHSYYLQSDKIVEAIVNNPETLFLYNVYIIRQPAHAVYTTLFGSPFAERYKTHSMYYSLLTDEDHSAYAKFNS